MVLKDECIKKNKQCNGIKSNCIYNDFFSHLDRLSGYANGLGTAGVSVFIVISGALMTVRHYEDSASHHGILDKLKWGDVKKGN